MKILFLMFLIVMRVDKMKALRIVTNWIVLVCLLLVPFSLIMAISATVAHVILHGWG